MNCLLLATASPARVARAATDLARRHPGSRVTVGASSRQERVLAARGLTTVCLGGSDLALDDRAVRASLAAAGYDLVVVPLDLPLQPLLYVLRLADHLATVPFELWLGRRLHCRRRRVVRLALLLFSWLLYPPLGLLVRAGRVADGALLLALHALARLGLRLPGRGPGIGAPG